MNQKLAVLLVFVIFAAFMIPQSKALIGGVNVTVTPSSQVAPQMTVATYTVTVSDTFAPGPPDSFTLSISGLSSSAVASFATNPLSVASPGSASTTLSINTGAYSAAFCPGSYSFTVTATDSSSNSGSGFATLVVTPRGPSLSVTVSTDKSSYTVGQQVTIILSVTRYAEGTLTISPPTGPPQTFGYQSLPPGSFQKTFSTLNQPIGRWTITLQADDYCNGFSSSVAYFDLSPNTYSVSISLSGVPASANVTLQVDGQFQGTMTGAEIKSLSFTLNTQHTVTVDQYVSSDQGIRYYSQQNSWTVSSGGSHTFNYQPQYYVTITTDPDGITPVSGSGWYNAGTSIQTTMAPQALNGSSGTRYAFKGWEVNGVLQSGNPVTITLDKPYKTIARYSTQYQLVIDSPYGNPTGSGFYDAGSTAQFSVTSPTGLLIQQIFVKWNGDFTGASPQGSVTMDAPKVVHATWTTSYMQLYLVSAAIAAAIVVAGFLFKRRRKAAPPTVKSPPKEESESGTAEPTSEKSGKPGSKEAATNNPKCASCGTEVPTGQEFCHICGAKMA